MIFSRRDATPESARESLCRLCDRAHAFQDGFFRTVVNTVKSRMDDIVNYFRDRRTNAYAESLNSKIKAFRASLRGVMDILFPVPAILALRVANRDTNTAFYR